MMTFRRLVLLREIDQPNSMIKSYFVTADSTYAQIKSLK